MGSFEVTVAAVADESLKDEPVDTSESPATSASHLSLSPAASDATAAVAAATVSDPLQQLLVRFSLDAAALQRVRQSAQWVKAQLLQFVLAHKEDAASVSLAQRLSQLVVQAEAAVRETAKHLQEDEALKMHLGYNSNSDSTGSTAGLVVKDPEDGFSEDNAFVYYCSCCANMLCVCDAPIVRSSMHVRAEDGAIALNESTRKFNKFAGRTQVCRVWWLFLDRITLYASSHRDKC